jgi:hypothetical protein
MRSQSMQGEASRRRAEDKFKSTKKSNANAASSDNTLRQAETEKTARLRALRLTKEAADKDAANREAAAAAARKAKPRPRVSKPQGSDRHEPK